MEGFDEEKRQSVFKMLEELVEKVENYELNKDDHSTFPS